jgi:hypothetical protein
MNKVLQRGHIIRIGCFYHARHASLAQKQGASVFNDIFSHITSTTRAQPYKSTTTSSARIQMTYSHSRQLLINLELYYIHLDVT